MEEYKSQYEPNYIKISLTDYQKKAPISTFCNIGSVAAGKTALAKFLTDTDTKKSKKEKINGITIKMGYANLKIYYDGKSFLLNPHKIPDGFRLIRHFSIADNPGHNSYMPAMITGSSYIDKALFVVSNNGIEPQSYQHMKCFKSTGIIDFAIIISKIDLIPTKQLLEDLVVKVDKFLDDQKLDPEIYNPPIIPLSSILGQNTDYLIKYLVSSKYPNSIIGTSQKEFSMTIMRSFDVNLPGTNILEMEGAVFGGSLHGGYLTIGDVVRILPGNVELKDGIYTCTPLITQVVSIRTNTSDIEVALPGGFIAFSTTLDPSYSKNNSMIGNIIVKVNDPQKIDQVYDISNIIFVSDVLMLIDDINLVVDNDYLLVIHGSQHMGKLVNISADSICKFVLTGLVATIKNERVVILTKIGETIDMIGYGKLHSIKVCDNIIIDRQFDTDEFFQCLPIKRKQIDGIELINDIEKIPEFDGFIDELLDIDKVSENITFDRKKYKINCENVFLETTTTSVIIKNAAKIMSGFTNDYDISIKLCNEFGKYIQTSIDTLKRASINCDGVQLSFDGLRNTRKYIGPQFNTLLNSFISYKFKCDTCHEIGPMFYETKKTYCRACTAVSMSKI